MHDLAAAVTLLRYAPASSLQRLAKLLARPTDELEPLSVALDAALEEGPIERRALAWRGSGKRVHAPILGRYAKGQPKYGERVTCIEGERVLGAGDLRGVARAWACDVAERVVRELAQVEPLTLDAIALSRRHVEGTADRKLVAMQDRARDAAFERPLDDARIAARTIALDTTLDDAWDAAWYVAQCGAGWAQRDVSRLLDKVGRASPDALSVGLRLVMEAQWLQLSTELEGRALAAIAAPSEGA